jgi:hypothetical protein
MIIINYALKQLYISIFFKYTHNELPYILKNYIITIISEN